MIKLAVSGAWGRMGQRITELALKDGGFSIHTLLEYKEHPKLNDRLHDIEVSVNNETLRDADILIEFTLPDGTMENLRAAVKHGVPMVIGTTGFTDDQRAEIEMASKKIPVLWSTNMSVGVNLLWKLIEQTAKVTGDRYKIEVEETHHIHKKDSPSGTAKTMIEIAEANSGRKVDDIEAFREGEVIGDHSIIFESDVDVISISHSAKTRDIFAEGALKAAKWLVDQQPGRLYHMRDVLF